MYSLFCNFYRYEVVFRDDGEELGFGDEEEEEVRYYRIYMDFYIV